MGFAIQPIKLLNPTGEFVSGKGTLYRQAFTTPAANGNTAVHAAVTSPATGTTVTTTGITNPVVPRVVRVKGSASGMTGNVVIVGTDQFGAAATDTVALNGATAVDGVVAFKTVTSFTIPAKINSSGDTVSLGVGQALGLDRRITVPICFGATYNAVAEGTLPTMNVANNTISLSTTLAGASVVAYYPHEDLAHA